MGSRNMIGRAFVMAGASVAVAAFASAPAVASGRGHAASGGGVASIEKLVPAAVKAKGTLTVAADATYAPDEFIASDGHTVIGMDADLMTDIAKTMGLKVSIKNVTFDTIIPAMLAGRFMVGASSFTDTAAREKQVNFVDYANVGESFYTLASGGTNIKSIANICGLTVSVETGTTEQTDAGTQSKACVKAGKKPVSVLPFSTQNSTRPWPAIKSPSLMASSSSWEQRTRLRRTASRSPSRPGWRPRSRRRCSTS